MTTAAPEIKPLEKSRASRRLPHRANDQGLALYRQQIKQGCPTPPRVFWRQAIILIIKHDNSHQMNAKLAYIHRGLLFYIANGGEQRKVYGHQSVLGMEADPNRMDPNGCKPLETGRRRAKSGLPCRFAMTELGGAADEKKPARGQH
ncbi:hypothetical protein [Chromobacterium subtsugae]|uniref:hypothetical protein n=1 Tax=Chromobacterium subtsugae TaxID=251747 RepID=UPI0012FFB6AF|nr:hypothetical protein [Chromobacterium subtsugae]